MNVEDFLKAAIKNSDVVKIVYLGGSQPGSAREITPIQIRDGKCRARCHISNAEKIFNISKMQLLEDSQPFATSAWNPEIQNRVNYSTIEEFVHAEAQNIFALGWHLESSDTSVSLHRKFKNGKPMIGSDVSLNFEEFTSDLGVDESGNEFEENVRKRVRPWVVRGKNKDTKTFSSLDGALLIFLLWAQQIALRR